MTRADDVTSFPKSAEPREFLALAFQRPCPTALLILNKMWRFFIRKRGNRNGRSAEIARSTLTPPTYPPPPIIFGIDPICTSRADSRPAFWGFLRHQLHGVAYFVFLEVSCQGHWGSRSILVRWLVSSCVSSLTYYQWIANKTHWVANRIISYSLYKLKLYFYL